MCMANPGVSSCGKIIDIDSDGEALKLSVPSAQRGGQKKQTARSEAQDAMEDTPPPPVRKRSRGKRSNMKRPAADAPRLRLSQKTKLGVLANKTIAQKNKDEDPVIKPVRIHRRKGTEKRVAESYLVDGAGFYIIGTTDRVTPDHDSIMEKLASKLNAGEVATRAQAKAMLHQLIRQGK